MNAHGCWLCRSDARKSGNPLSSELDVELTQRSVIRHIFNPPRNRVTFMQRITPTTLLKVHCNRLVLATPYQARAHRASPKIVQYTRLVIIYGL